MSKTAPTSYLACDLGAESGRLMLGTLANDRLGLEELHRFPNVPLQTESGLHWDIPQLLAELKTGLRKAADARPVPVSISADSWGLDYALFRADGTLISPTFHYRDARTATGVQNVFGKVDWKAVFAETGIQFMPINSIYQLAAENPERLSEAEFLLGVGDAFNYFLSGVASPEVSLASTSQLYNPRLNAWSETLISALGLPAKLFLPIVPAGTALAPLRSDLCRETGLPPIQVIATCSHDTGAAVAAVPVEDPTRNWCYLSSGTWSLLGAEVPAPVIDDLCRDLNFTNEVGYGGSIRLLTNIVGLWIVQECKRAWASEGQEFDYGELTRLAAKSAAFVSLIDPRDERFLSPGNMPGKIAAFCDETGQPAPESPAATVRCVLESLALLYRARLRQLETLTFSRFEQMHIVGGGSKNELLNQFTANALEIPVHAGPVEATALGNIIVQAIALGDLPSLEAARKLVHRSSAIRIYYPEESEAWRAASLRFGELMKRSG
jgi:rhamnulokinase